jgi:hypothetical protein
MNINPLKKGIMTVNFDEIGEVSNEMLQQRTLELALINGRPEGEVSQSDRDQARRELTDNPEIDPKREFLESAPESERWDPVHGSTGHENKPIPYGDDEGRSDAERLVEEGVKEAEHDQMLQAAKAQRDRDES